MKLVTYHYNGKTSIGAVQDESVIDLSAVATSMLRLVEAGAEGLAQAQDYVGATQELVSLESVSLQAPLPRPTRNIMCLGLNYADHAEEAYATQGRQTQLPEFPIVFTKATTTVNGPYDDIPFDATVSEEIDWEVELGVIIGRYGRNIPRQQAMDYVFGYTVINDITARDLQRQHKQYFKGKSLDGFCPMGPWIVSADALDPGRLRLTSRVNSVTKQDSNTQHMIFAIPDIIAHLSRGMTLLPGDIIATGTPSGVGFARQPPEFLKPGDVVECEIENVGVIKNQVVAG
jgi:2-keto-4-pentenoate hydratase/2-oxohepta-3-ene-1,7-dioic acid hydratase in catechol pathway